MPRGTKIRKGDRVRLNDRYAEFFDHHDDEFMVVSDPFVRKGCTVVLLDHGFEGAYAADGLEVVSQCPR